MVSAGKFYKLYCNSQINRFHPAEHIKNVEIPEKCADHCAEKDNCGHAFYNAKYQNCFLRPKPDSVKKRSFAGKTGSMGNTWAWVYDRDAPESTGDTSGDNAGGSNRDSNKDSNKDNNGHNNGHKRT